MLAHLRCQEEELLETPPHEFLGRALGEKMQRKEVNIPCKEKQLSASKELGFQSQVAGNKLQFPTAPTTLRNKIVGLCVGLIAALPSLRFFVCLFCFLGVFWWGKNKDKRMTVLF